MDDLTEIYISIYLSKERVSINNTIVSWTLPFLEKIVQTRKKKENVESRRNFRKENSKYNILKTSFSLFPIIP